MTSMKFEHLFAPLQVGPMRVPNRICETTNTINSSMAPGLIDDHFIAHHGAKARGGTGWIGGETWLLNLPLPKGAPDEISLRGGFGCHQAAYQNPAFAEGWKKFTDEVHRHGAVVVVQLTHLNALWSPSPVPVVGAQDYTPHVLGEEEIEFLLQTYADAAEVAKNTGADGIEIHCAHETVGYSFLSPVTNRRKDRWGGGPRERVRFAAARLELRFGRWQGRKDPAKKYRSVALDAAVRVRQIGLLQALAFWLSKHSDNREAEHELVEDLMTWLVSSKNEEVYRLLVASAAPARRAVGSAPSQAMSILPPLLERTSLELAALEAEAVSYLGWLKRIFEGWWVVTHKGESDSQGSSGAEP